MKRSNTIIVTLLQLLLITSTTSWAISDTDLTKNFITCLAHKIHPSYYSYPITNAIYTPHNSSFPSIFETYVQNDRFLSPNHSNPLVIITATHESHVQATVICSKANDLMLRTRSGGHDYEGVSYLSHVLPYVLLDMFNLRNMSIDLVSETMWVQSGATLGEVYYNIAANSKTLAFPAGLCPTVGVGGHLSGGGFGTLVRKYGLATDNVVDAKVVDVNGRILDRKAMGEDLFWAISGGGGASFGVVISWKFKLVKVPLTVTVFMVNSTTDQGATELVHKWQDVATTISDDLFIRLELRPVKSTIEATFVGLFLGNMDNLFQLMKEKFAELGLEKEHCMEMSWIESTLYFYTFPKGTPITALLIRETRKVAMKSKSDFVKEPISKEALEVIWKKMIQIREVWMQWNPYGGRMSEIPSTQTPTPRRAGYLFKIQYLVYWTEEGKQDNYLELSRQLYSAMTPYVTKSPRETFLNYRDFDIGCSPYANATYEEAKVYGMKYFNKNFDRLVQVKTKVDPDNFFRDEQSIPVLPQENSFSFYLLYFKSCHQFGKNWVMVNVLVYLSPLPSVSFLTITQACIKHRPWKLI